MRLKPACRTSSHLSLVRPCAWTKRWWSCSPFALTLLLIGLAFPGESAADDAQVLMPETEVTRIAGLLMEKAEATNMFGEPCRVYLADREGAVGTLIAAQSFVDLRDVMSQELRQAQPNRACEISILDAAGRPDISQALEKQNAKKRSGSLLSLALFQSLDGVMMFAKGYRPDGTFAMFTDRIDVALEPSGETVPGQVDTVGGPSLPVPADDVSVQLDRAPSPRRQVEESPLSDPGKKSFLESLRERVGTERAE